MRASVDRGLYSEDIDWYLTRRDAECGIRSSLGGQIAAIERGNTHSTATPDPYHDGQADLGPVAFRSFTRDRVMLPRWRRMSRASRLLLTVHYTGTAPTELENNSRAKFPIGVEGTWAQLSAVVLWQCESEGPEAYGKALDLAQKAAELKANADHSRAIAKLRSRAERAVRAAHEEYYQVKESEADAWAATDTDDEPAPALDWAAEFASIQRRQQARKGPDGVWRQ